MVTYRLQLTPDSGFAAAREALPYLRDLGITHLYLSPISEARAGSTHGYDATDPTRIRSQLGGEHEIRLLSDSAHALGLRILLDIVPNHMAADTTNPWWRDILQSGPASPYAPFFDIDWAAGGGKLILPILGRSPATAIAAGELTLHPGPPPQIRYFDRLLPTAPGTADSGPLPDILDRQHYRLIDWREGPHRVNYRRFFDIGDLAGLAAERPEVLEATHRLPLSLLHSGQIDGLRIDHIDGLLDPARYLRELRERTSPSLPILVEKILAEDESLPPDWPVDGTTGYEFLNLASALFIDPGGLSRIQAAARADLGLPPFAQTAIDCKARAAETLFPADLARLASAFSHAFDAAGAPDRPCTDSLRRSLIAISARLRVYRTYIRSFPASPTDLARIDQAADGADIHPTLLAALRGDPPFNSGPAAAAALDAIGRWQQFTGPLAAKGIEDTALYRHITLASLNEVGGEPEPHTDALEAFHTRVSERAARWPLSLNATATHDTKRGEDTRLRINTLSEFSDEWLASLARWRAWHAPLRARLPAGDAPSPAAESLFYQSLLGVWPAQDGPLDDIADRLTAAMTKSAREAKLRTSWLAPDEPYESALRSYIREILLGDAGRRFREDARPLRRAASFFGAISSLAQVVIKVLAPGSPDFYQGTEFWDTSLVDPDNRRPVDFTARASALALLPPAPPPPALLADLMAHWPTGLIKLFTIRAALACRLELGDSPSPYTPLHPRGHKPLHILAFQRSSPDHPFLTIVPRLTATLTTPDTFPLGPGVWGDTAIPLPEDSPRRWRNRFTGEEFTAADAIPVHAALASFPVAILSPA